MELFATLAAFVTILAGTAVGIRIVLRSQSDHSLPELAVGIALVAFCGLAQPLSIARVALEGQIPPATASGLQVASTLASAFALLCLYLFTWRVFRPDSRWAVMLFAGGSALGLWAGAGIATLSYYDSTFSPQIIGRWLALSALSYAICFAWGGAESLAYYVRHRRRAKVGLAEPLLVNRFLLWSGSCTASLAIDLILVASAWHGVDFNTDDGVKLLVSLSSLVQAITWYLGFTPPAWYVRWVVGPEAAEGLRAGV